MKPGSCCELCAVGTRGRRASLPNDVLIAMTARRVGATLYTGDAQDFDAIRDVLDFSLEVVGRAWCPPRSRPHI